MATAYTIRYGSANADFGPGLCTVASEGGGGGSITDRAAEGFASGSGSEGIGSSADEVSIVMCLVTGGDCLKV